MSQAVQRNFNRGSRVRWEGFVDLSGKASVANKTGSERQIVKPIRNIKTQVQPKAVKKNILAAFLFGMISAVLVVGYIAIVSEDNQEEKMLSYKDLELSFEQTKEKSTAIKEEAVELPNLHVTVRNGKKEFSPALKKELIARIAKQEADTKPIKRSDPMISGSANKVYAIIKNYIPHEAEGMKLAYAIVQESRRARYDPLFVAAVIKSESAFNRFATSPVGAKGLMQIMPQTGKYVANTFDEFQDVPKGYLTDVGYNLKLGIAYLKYLEEMFQGNRVLTLIAYNWGPGRVDNTLQGKTRGVPKEVMNYALKILSDHQKWTREVAIDESKLLA